MATLRKMKQLTPNAMSVLKKCGSKGVEVWGGFRTFCECGHVTNKHLDKCPDCGNTEFYYLNYGNCELKTEVVIRPDCREIIKTSIRGNEVGTDYNLEIIEESIAKVYSLTNIRFTNPHNTNMQIILNLKDKLFPPNEVRYIEMINQTYWCNYNNFSNNMNAVKRNEKFVNENYSKLKGSNFSWELLPKLPTNYRGTYEDALRDIFGVPEQFVEHIRPNKYYDFSALKNFGETLKKLPERISNILAEKYMEEPYSLWGMNGISSSLPLIRDNEDAVLKYMKKYEYKLCKNGGFLNEIVRKMNKLEELGVPINGDTLDDKVINHLENTAMIEKNGWTQDVIEKHLANFDTNAAEEIIKLAAERRVGTSKKAS